MAVSAASRTAFDYVKVDDGSYWSGDNREGMPCSA
jgi:hypothetical protein